LEGLRRATKFLNQDGRMMAEVDQPKHVVVSYTNETLNISIVVCIGQ
jgi:hypothetical protein